MFFKVKHVLMQQCLFVEHTSLERFDLGIKLRDNLRFKTLI